MLGLLITINYNSSKETIHFLKSLGRLRENSSIDIYVVDNSQDDVYCKEMMQYANSSSLKVNFIRPKRNLGYFRAARHVISKHIPDILKYDYCIVCNNDLEIQDTGFFSKIQSYVNKAHVIAPAIETLPARVSQNPHREEPLSRKQKTIYRLFFVHSVSGRILHFLRSRQNKWFRKNRKTLRKETERYIFAAHGAMFVFTRSYFLNGGYITDGLFLYGEEDFVAAVCQEKCMKILYVPALKVFHMEHSATNTSSISRRKFRYQKEAYAFICSKYPKYFR